MRHGSFAWYHIGRRSSTWGTCKSFVILRCRWKCTLVFQACTILSRSGTAFLARHTPGAKQMTVRTRMTMPACSGEVTPAGTLRRLSTEALGLAWLARYYMNFVRHLHVTGAWSLGGAVNSHTAPRQQLQSKR
jgi:hypothetical protein